MPVLKTKTNLHEIKHSDVKHKQNLKEINISKIIVTEAFRDLIKCNNCYKFLSYRESQSFHWDRFTIQTGC